MDGFLSLFDRHDWPDIELGTCPETGDEDFVIVHDDGPNECYHCGAEVDEQVSGVTDS